MDIIKKIILVEIKQACSQTVYLLGGGACVVGGDVGVAEV